MRHDAGPRVDATVQPALMPGGRVSVNQAQPTDDLAAIRKPRMAGTHPADGIASGTRSTEAVLAANSASIEERQVEERSAADATRGPDR